MVYTHYKGRGVIFSRRAHYNFFSARVDVFLSSFLGEEQTGRFDNNLSAHFVPFQVSRIFFGSYANTPQAVSHLDPISTFTGEDFDTFPPDLSLGGPLPIEFRRYYASMLSRDGRRAQSRTVQHRRQAGSRL